MAIRLCSRLLNHRIAQSPPARAQQVARFSAQPPRFSGSKLDMAKDVIIGLYATAVVGYGLAGAIDGGIQAAKRSFDKAPTLKFGNIVHGCLLGGMHAAVSAAVLLPTLPISGPIYLWSCQTSNKPPENQPKLPRQ